MPIFTIYFTCESFSFLTFPLSHIHTNLPLFHCIHYEVVNFVNTTMILVVRSAVNYENKLTQVSIEYFKHVVCHYIISVQWHQQQCVILRQWIMNWQSMTGVCDVKEYMCVKFQQIILHIFGTVCGVGIFQTVPLCIIS